MHGGDPLSDPAHKHMYGRIILFSGRDGRLLRWIATPDRRESYYPPQVNIMKCRLFKELKNDFCGLNSM